jgi:Spy/CpxP family protein refolding chaperone
MRTKWVAAVLAVALGASASLAQEPKNEQKPAEKAEGKAKGQLPMYWKQLGLSEEQVQKVYKLQSKYNEEIDVLEAKIKELKDRMAKERLAILTADQKKRLEDVLKEKAGTDKKDK